MFTVIVVTAVARRLIHFRRSVAEAGPCVTTGAGTSRRKIRAGRAGVQTRTEGCLGIRFEIWNAWCSVVPTKVSSHLHHFRARPPQNSAVLSHHRDRRRRLPLFAVGAALLLTQAMAPSVRACACGCGIYEVGTSSMIPTDSGVMTFLDYDYQDQSRNWSGTSGAPAADNGDKDIRTSWYTLGYQDMVSRDWGVRMELPYEERHFVTTGGATGNDIVSLNYRGIGDIRIEGIYTGFSSDFSKGLTFGFKLPTGSHTTNDVYQDIDRDTQIGSGSTDILLGGFDRFALGPDWSGFSQALLDVPVLSQVQYRPGTEFDAAVGAYYDGLRIGGLKISPIGQIKLSVRSRDTGANSADPVASGFVRVLAAPGLEFDLHPVKVYTDVELQLYYHFTGDQLVAKTLFRVIVSYMF
jgi:hypothetical protein